MKIKKMIAAIAAALVTALTAMTAPMTTNAEADDPAALRAKIAAEFQELFGPFYTLGEDASLYQKGDITMDGIVNALDVQAILKAVNWIVMLEDFNYLTDAQMELGNIVQRNILSDSFPLDTIDALAVMRYINYRDVLEEDVTLEQIAAAFENGR